MWRSSHVAVTTMEESHLSRLYPNPTSATCSSNNVVDRIACRHAAAIMMGVPDLPNEILCALPLKRSELLSMVKVCHAYNHLFHPRLYETIEFREHGDRYDPSHAMRHYCHLNLDIRLLPLIRTLGLCDRQTRALVANSRYCQVEGKTHIK